MATEIQIRAQLDTMRYLPPQLERLSASLGTVNWPGQAQRLNFPIGMELTAADREDLQRQMDGLAALTTGSNLEPSQCLKAKLSLLTKLLLGSATGASSDAAADARLEMYELALEGIAPWAIDAARRRWAQGKVPASVRSPNFSFAPSPADLRAICEDELRPFTDQMRKIKRLLSAVPLDRAMDPEPIPVEAKSESGRVVRIATRRM